MSQRVPQVIVSLTASGQLKVELPGAGASRRSIEMTEASAGASLLRILQAQLGDQVEIGTDGAPTTQQLAHWEKHDLFPRGNCRFCMAEGRGTGQAKAKKKVLIERRSDGVEIKKLTEGLKAKAKSQSPQTAKELGL